MRHLAILCIIASQLSAKPHSGASESSRVLAFTAPVQNSTIEFTWQNKSSSAFLLSMGALFGDQPLYEFRLKITGSSFRGKDVVILSRTSAASAKIPFGTGTIKADVYQWMSNSVPNQMIFNRAQLAFMSAATEVGLIDSAEMNAEC